VIRPGRRQVSLHGTGQVAWESLWQQVIAIWQLPTWPRVAEYRILRSTVTEALPGFGKPISSNTNALAPVVASAISLVTRCRLRSSESHRLLVRNSCRR
jgi:hypothetical protein